MEHKNNGHSNGSLSQYITRHAARSLTAAGAYGWTDTLGHKPHTYLINDPPTEKYYNDQ